MIAAAKRVRWDQHQVTASARCPIAPPNAKGCFVNRGGYSLTKIRDDKCWWSTKAIYECVLDVHHPLGYMDEKGVRWQIGPRQETDMGSIPLVAQLVIPKDRGLLSYLHHDYACRYKGLFVLSEGVPVFVKLTRAQTDRLLLDMLHAEGTPDAQRYAVYAGVRAYAICAGK